MVPALLVEDAAKRYGRVRALDGVSLEVQPGELVGLLGPNGAGKSTLVKIACGLIRASRGRAPLSGLVLRRRGAAPSPTTGGSPGGVDERGRLLELVGLAKARTVRVDAMSKGMQQRLGIAQALVSSPPVLLLDEPTSALDPAGRRTVRALLEELREREIGVLLNSHLLSEIELVCDRVVILSGGRVVAAGRPKELSQPRGVEIETDEGVRLFSEARRDQVPGLVERLVGEGRQIYGVRVLATSLEEEYLDAVGGDTA
jgi:ABC-2 type transport system ATP-binding protein